MTTGSVPTTGTDHTVDFASPRDHSWSPRPESTSGYGIPMSGNFDYGSFGPSGQDFTFFVQTRNEWEDLRRGHVHNGYIIEHGTLLGIKHGEGRYTYAPNWSTTYLEYELEDERGKTHLFKGEPISFYPGGVGFLDAFTIFIFPWVLCTRIRPRTRSGSVLDNAWGVTSSRRANSL